jgi:chromate reductase
LRHGSYNRAALRAAVELTPDSMEIEVFDLAPIPMYNEDLRAQGWPEPVAELRRRIAGVDALLIVTPEYNYSIPAALKNAIDWASRPPDPPLNDKPLAIMGASPGERGTVRAQYHLRQVCVSANLHPLNRPEVMIAQCNKKFDADGKLTDRETRDRIRALLVALMEWSRRLRSHR